MTNSKILDRVRKLLALSRDNTNVNEAAVAAATAQRLIFEHQISAEQLEIQDEPLIKGSVYRVKGKQMQAWRHTLVTGLAKSLDAKAIRTGQDLVVFGTQDQIETVAYMFQYLDRTITELSENDFEVQLAENVKTARSSFCKGATYVICARLYEQYKAQRQKIEHSNSTALTVINSKLARVEREYEQAFPNATGAQHAPAKHEEAYLAGARAGAKIPLEGRAALGQTSSANRMLGS